jgi:hypothetical protein
MLVGWQYHPDAGAESDSRAAGALAKSVKGDFVAVGEK